MKLRSNYIIVEYIEPLRTKSLTSYLTYKITGGMRARLRRSEPHLAHIKTSVFHQLSIYPMTLNVIHTKYKINQSDRFLYCTKLIMLIHITYYYICKNVVTSKTRVDFFESSRCTREQACSTEKNSMCQIQNSSIPCFSRPNENIHAYYEVIFEKFWKD